MSIWNLNDKKTEAKWMELNEQDYYAFHYNAFTDIMLSMFKYENLPDSMDEYFIEKALFHNGSVAFYRKGESGKVYNYYVTGSSQVDRYGYPGKYTLTTDAGVDGGTDVNAEDVVVGYNNYLRSSTRIMLHQPCVRLADMEMTIDTNLFAQKMPFIIETDINNKNSIMTMFSQFKRNAKAIFTRKGKGNVTIDGDNFKVHNTDAPFIADKVLALMHDLKNDVLTRLGINNTDLEKKERLITSEAESNVMEIKAHALSFLDSRKKMIDEVNEKFNLDITVDYRDKQKFDDFILNLDELDQNEREGDYYE